MRSMPYSSNRRIRYVPRGGAGKRQPLPWESHAHGVVPLVGVGSAVTRFRQTLLRGQHPAQALEGRY